MRPIFKIVTLFLSLALIQCSSDDSTSSSNLLYNGGEFKTGNGSGYNTFKNESDGGIWLNIREKGSDDPKNILVVLYHEAGSHSGTFTLRNNLAEDGVANVVIMDDDGHQLLGGSVNGPTGTLTVVDKGNNNFKITFNDVVLDHDTETETTITGTIEKKFSPSGN